MSVASLLRTIVVLLVALCAPGRMIARVRACDRRTLRGIVLFFQVLEQRGYRLWRDGERLAAVEARIDRIVWMAHDPFAAQRHIARRLRGWLRAVATAAPPGFAPPRLPCAPLAAACVAPAVADTS